MLYNGIIENQDILKDNNLELIIIDNTPNRDLELHGVNIHYIPLLRNIGIANAQNIGIKEAKNKGCKYIVFFDQDSRISSKLIMGLYNEFIKIKSSGINLAALGPSLVEIQTGSKYKGSSTIGEAKRVNTLISSGTFTEIQVLNEVGGFNEKMFIDLVDHEWAWRAQSKGYCLYQSTSTILYHQVGKKSIKVMGFPILISAPLRYYYQYRNTIWLLKCAHVPKLWKKKIVLRRFVELFIVPFKTGEWLSTVRNIYKGIKDGIVDGL